MRLAFFGSGDFGIPTLEALAADGHEVVAVVTRPDRPAGRGGRVRATPVKGLAERLSLPILQPRLPNDPGFAGVLAGFNPDLAVVVAYGHLIRRPLLSIPRRGFVNLHASLLPAYRGAAPAPWAILSGETVSGATAFCLNERFDEGGIVGKVELAIAPDDTAGSYLEKLAPVGARLMRRIVPEFMAGGIAPQPQDEASASRAPKLSKADGAIDWRLSFKAINDKVRAFQPWPLAHTELPTAKGGLGVSLLRIEPVRAAGDRGPGEIVAADAKTGLVVMTGDVPARLSLLLPEGRRPMTDTDFLRGTRVTR